ncbi:anti-sigma factor [Echinicola pacifica]|uniref:Anti-sigma factor n=1 Tax=Echinicola pacifica TaxID=346377 RepID=A0A918Q9M2_9BACT|nr:FecR domain-containing protein [Echinicola pacifica]GGZ37331.1 anti-sigma factor [Echinicola pacifica]
MKYDEFDIEDFLNDEFFIQWVKHPGDETDHFWIKWVAEHPEKIQLIQKARQIILFVDYKDKSFLSDKAYTDLYENIVQKSEEPESGKGTRFHWSSWHKVAAILLVVFSSFYCIRYFVTSEQHPSSPSPGIIVKCNPAGQKSSFKLPDGTVVILNASSKLEYPEDFSSETRELSLSGEAFFCVKEDKSRPFIIHTDQDEVRVLGTTFNVSNHQNQLAIALVEGSLALKEASGKETTIRPKELLVKDAYGQLRSSIYDPVEVLGWKDKTLVFKDDSFLQLVDKLERWYGVKISAEMELDSLWSYSGIYQDKSLEYVLDGISIASEFTYKIDQKNITITNPKQQ